MIDTPGKFAFVDGSGNRTEVTKTGTNQWKDFTFQMTSPRIFVIDALDTGNETVHRLIVEPAG
jgi:hypothetical protein